MYLRSCSKKRLSFLSSSKGGLFSLSAVASSSSPETSSDSSSSAAAPNGFAVLSLNPVILPPSPLAKLDRRGPGAATNPAPNPDPDPFCRLPNPEVEGPLVDAPVEAKEDLVVEPRLPNPLPVPAEENADGLLSATEPKPDFDEDSPPPREPKPDVADAARELNPEAAKALADV